MKSTVTVLTFSISFLLLIGCEDENAQEPEATDMEVGAKFEILNGACGSILFLEPVSTNLEDALALVSEEKTEEYIRYCTNNPCDEVIIKSQPFEVDYLLDDREFYGLTVRDKMTGNLLESMAIVLDTRGNRYDLEWCLD